MSRKIYFRGLSREDNEAFAAGLTSGGWVEVPAYSVTELCKKSEGIAHVSEEDKAALNPSYNSRYNMLKNRLTQHASQLENNPWLRVEDGFRGLLRVCSHVFLVLPAISLLHGRELVD